MEQFATDFIIGFDASPITGRKTGVEYYSLQIYRALKKEIGENNLIAFTNKPIPEIPEAKVYPSKLPLSLWRQLILPKALKQHQISSLHSPITAIPYHSPCPIAATVHDLSYRIAPEGVNYRYRFAQKLNCTAAVKKAAKIVTVSDTTRQLLCRYYPKLQGKYITILSGALANPIISEFQNTAKFNDRPYFVQIGRLDKRKEPLTSLEAFKQSGVFSKYRLLFIGSPGNEMENISKWLSANPQVAENVRISGYLAENEVYQTLANADALLYPSKDEGFGHPPFEALALKTLPIVSDIQVLRELLLQAAVFVPVSNIDALAEQMKKLADGEINTAQIFAAGEERLQTLQWQKTAKKIIELHYELYQKKRESK